MTHSVTHCCWWDSTDVTLAVEDADSKLLDVVTVAEFNQDFEAKVWKEFWSWILMLLKGSYFGERTLPWSPLRHFQCLMNFERLPLSCYMGLINWYSLKSTGAIWEWTPEPTDWWVSSQKRFLFTSFGWCGDFSQYWLTCSTQENKFNWDLLEFGLWA